jgi:hypothetical protein
MENQNKPNTVGIILITILLILLTYAGFLSYKSIDYKILEKLEATPLDLPPQPTTIPQTLQPH